HRVPRAMFAVRTSCSVVRAGGHSCGQSSPYARAISSLRAEALGWLVTKEDGMAIDIGITKKDREGIAKNLSKLLADTYSLYLKTHGFHWNITGPMFNTLHTMFETQYNELWTAADVIAERIRALDIYAPGSYTQFAKLTSVPEETGVPEW